MGAASVLIEEGKTNVHLQTGVAGTFSSTHPELYGVLITLNNTPSNIKLNNHAVLANIKERLNQRTAPVTTTKISSHTGDYFNDLTDKLAKEAALQLRPASLPESDQLYLHHNDIMLDVPIRPLIKSVNRKRIENRMKGRLEKYFPNKQIREDLTIPLLAMPQSLTEKSFRIKCVFSILPTSERSQRWKKTPENMATCKRCVEAKETNNHFWNCPKNNFAVIRSN